MCIGNCESCTGCDMHTITLTLHLKSPIGILKVLREENYKRTSTGSWICPGKRTFFKNYWAKCDKPIDKVGNIPDSWLIWK